MDSQTKYLIDEIIRYSTNQKMPLSRAVSHLVELAKQRLPEYRLESDQLSGEYALVQQILKSEALSIVMRVPIRSWIHEVRWIYYPEFHVINRPIEYYAFPVHAKIETWPAVSDAKTIFLDDLFFDKEEKCFWQPEPFLSDISVSARFYKHITSGKLEHLRGTPFLKINPDFITKFLQTRSGLPNYSIRRCDSEMIYRSRPYGSKGWKKRMTGVQKYWSKRRKSDWNFK